MSEHQRGQVTVVYPDKENARPVCAPSERGWVVDAPEEDCPLCEAEKCIQFRGRMDPMKVYHVRK